MLDSGEGSFGFPGLGVSPTPAAGPVASTGGKRRPALQFSIPCLEVNEEKGPPSFNYIFYELPFPQFPFKFPDNAGFFIANGWCNGLGEYKQRMRIYGPRPQGQSLLDEAPLVDTGEQPFSLKERETPFMAINFIQGMEFKAPGTYRIQVLLNDEVALEYPMVVRQAQGQGQGPGAAPKKP
ncbi:MAG TPA: hypothetical protein VGO93_02385 [Candidatus Xenobia bacterium]|jgi:hypothetical protein